MTMLYYTNCKILITLGIVNLVDSRLWLFIELQAQIYSNYKPVFRVTFDVISCILICFKIYQIGFSEFFLLTSKMIKIL